MQKCNLGLGGFRTSEALATGTGIGLPIVLVLARRQDTSPVPFLSAVAVRILAAAALPVREAQSSGNVVMLPYAITKERMSWEI